MVALDVGGTSSATGFHHIRVEGALDEEVHGGAPVSYTHLRAHETVLDLVCRLLLEKKNTGLTTDSHI